MNNTRMITVPDMKRILLKTASKHLRVGTPSTIQPGDAVFQS